MRKYISPLIVGFAAGIIQVVPIIKSFACCLIIPFATYISLRLDQKANNDYSKILMSKAFVWGLIIGIVSAITNTFFETFITFITKQNEFISNLPEFSKMIDNFPIDDSLKNEVMNIFTTVRNDLINNGFSMFYTFTIFINNIIVNSIFGIVGSLISATFINNKNNNMSIE